MSSKPYKTANQLERFRTSKNCQYKNSTKIPPIQGGAHSDTGKFFNAIERQCRPSFMNYEPNFAQYTTRWVAEGPNTEIENNFRDITANEIKTRIISLRKNVGPGLSVIKHIQNGNFSEYVYHTSSDEKFESILQPLLEMIQHKLRGNYLYAEEYLIKFLQQNRTHMDTEDVLDLSRHMSACVAHLYVILISMVLSVILGFPLVFCSKTCYKKASNPKEHKYRLFTQCVVFSGALTFLLVGCVSSWTIGVKAQQFIERLPIESTDIIDVLNQTRTRFQINCKKLNLAVDTNILHISALPHTIHKRILDMMNEKANVNYSILLEKFNSMANKMEEVFNALGFIGGDELAVPFVILDDKLHYLSRMVSDMLLKHADILPNVTKVNDIIFPNNYDYLNRQQLHYEMFLLLRILFPATNATIRVVDRIKENLKQVRNQGIKQISHHVEQTKNFISKQCSNLVQAMETLISNRMEQMISNVTDKIKSATTYPLFSKEDESYTFKLTWLFVLPSIYGFVVLFLFVCAIIGTGKEMQSTINGNISTGIYTTRFYKVAIYISITFLWLVLLITAVLYFIHIPTVVVCGALNKGKLTDRYLDKPYWNNQTWMMHNLRKYTVLKSPMKITTFLEKCSQNETFIKALNLEININEMKLRGLLETSKKQYSDIFAKQTFANFRKIFRTMNHIDYNYFDINIIQQIGNGIHKADKYIESLQIEFATQNLTKKAFEEDVINIQKLLLEIAYFTGFLIKSGIILKECKIETIELMELNNRLEGIIKQDLLRSVNVYLNNITDDISCLSTEIEQFIRRSLLYDFGNCTFLPYIYNKLKWLICDYGSELLNCFWLSLAILGFSILIACILACRIACYVRGSYKMHSYYLLNCRRYSRPSDTGNLLNAEYRKST